MRFLIDTHVLLWWLAEDGRLGPVWRGLIASGQPIVSIASLWEIGIKHSLGKLEIDAETVALLVNLQVFERLGIQDRHIFAMQTLPRIHRDPFDRMLIAQSLAETLPLMTVDPKFRAYECEILCAS